MQEQDHHEARLQPLGNAAAFRSGIGAAEVIALVLSLLWIIGVTLGLVFVRNSGGDTNGSLSFVLTLIAIFLPVAIVWIAAAGARHVRTIREDINRLHVATDALRMAQTLQTGAVQSKSLVEKRLDEIVAAQKKTESAIATFASIRPQTPTFSSPRAASIPQATPLPATGDGQAALALGATLDDMSPPVGLDELIRALHFPENPDDKNGFRALRRALQDRKIGQLVLASQDVLTLLSQEGIYMDDLHPDKARPEIWRRFAKGERGRAISVLGGVRDRASLTKAAARMRSDTIFRDAVHHFLRKFDQLLADVEATATDLELAELADTRTARAFMLLGRVAGTFD
jgi:hypothetical protein